MTPLLVLTEQAHYLRQDKISLHQHFWTQQDPPLIMNDSPDSPASRSPEKKKPSELTMDQALASLKGGESKQKVLDYLATLNGDEEDDRSMFEFLWNTSVNNFRTAAIELRDQNPNQDNVDPPEPISLADDNVFRLSVMTHIASTTGDQHEVFGDGLGLTTKDTAELGKLIASAIDFGFSPWVRAVRNYQVENGGVAHNEPLATLYVFKKKRNTMGVFVRVGPYRDIPGGSIWTIA